MVYKGQFLYRYKFALHGSAPEVTVHTFEVTKVEDIECAWGVRTQITTKCFEDPQSIKLYDGRVSPEDLKLGVVRSAGGCKFVLLDTEDYDKACRLVYGKVAGDVEAAQAKLASLQSELDNALSLLNC